MKNPKHGVCPVQRAGSLDSSIRRWFQNPRKILAPYIHEGMVALDVGCGPGFFTVALADMVGDAGRVVACDLQDEMLLKLRAKIDETPQQDRITLHKCEADRIGVTGRVDFVLAFYVLHEIPDQLGFFEEMRSILLPVGHVLVVEPPFHVSRKAFNATIGRALETGFATVAAPRILFSKTALLQLVP
ncbi:class I SAM-dependent methyltransferase [Desulfatitalea alkaliphila]|uniref:Class I SAM-dependent methyltransferase n=1 Tax=Desulfatitalea alkaliphila TaxID=2929485 RepID=A0AA41UP95_9BACT|nr:class I SAM-dependent methyltransferase [Desulfatitalea alkaliphila]MCJ8500263.1 class I SAM-dependent methyltransferase [Desulfatitalea alkaliphila]